MSRARLMNTIRRLVIACVIGAVGIPIPAIAGPESTTCVPLLNQSVYHDGDEVTVMLVGQNSGVAFMGGVFVALQPPGNQTKVGNTTILNITNSDPFSIQPTTIGHLNMDVSLFKPLFSAIPIGNGVWTTQVVRFTGIVNKNTPRGKWTIHCALTFDKTPLSGSLNDLLTSGKVIIGSNSAEVANIAVQLIF